MFLALLLLGWLLLTPALGESVTLSVSPLNVPAGGTVTATWAGIASPTSTDWLGLYTIGAVATAASASRYTNGAASGSLPLALPGGLTPGTYELRLYAANGYTTLYATSPSFTVTAATTGGVKAFPTAEGYGANSVGGRGGRVVHVTNLNDSGTGSLRDALTVQNGARYIYFDVSGTILLTNGPIVMLQPQCNNVTIAGQTSPGGVQVRGDGIFYKNGCHDLIMRHMRIRPGTHCPGWDTSGAVDCYTPCPGLPAGDLACNTQDTNGFIAWAENEVAPHDIIIDHSSLQWATDQQGPDAFHSVYGMTTQWSIIGPGTNEGHNGPPPSNMGNHNFGILIGGPAAPAPANLYYSLHHNLMPNLGGRIPLLGRSEVVDIRNNIVYNPAANGALQWGSYMQNGGEYGCVDVGASTFGNFVNNLYLPGPSNQDPYFVIMNAGPTRLHGNQAERGGSKIYTSGNWGGRCPGGCANDWDNYFWNLDNYFASLAPPLPGSCIVITYDENIQATEAQFRVGTPFAAPPVSTDSPGILKAKLLPTIGASKPSRDSGDTAIVNDVLNNTGDPLGLGSGGPWPTLSGGSPPTDSDGDGIPDAWEDAHQLQKFAASDANTPASNGYPNIENYLNELAGDTITAVPSTLIYVDSVDGNDGNSCAAAANLTTPKQHIATGTQSAITCLQPGYTLYIRGLGPYAEAITNSTLAWPSGTAAAPMTITSYNNETVQLNQGIAIGNNPGGGVVSYLILDHLTVRNAGAPALTLGGDSQHISVTNSDLATTAITPAVEQAPDVVTITQQAGWHTLRANTIHDAPVALQGGSTRSHDGLVLSGHDTLIEGNTFSNNTGAGLMQGSTATTNTIRANVFVGNCATDGARAQALHALNLLVGTSTQVSNSVIYGHACAGAGSVVEVGGTTIEVDHNTITANAGTGIHVTSGAVSPHVRNNILFGNDVTTVVNGGATGTPLISNNLATDPIFANAVTHDYRLTQASVTASPSAIDQGVTLASVPQDALGIARPQPAGGVSDIGAYEYSTLPVPGAQALRWRFDEASGSSATDSSGNNETGTLVAFPTRSPGRTGTGALTFDGMSQYVTQTALAWAPNQAVTVLLWVKSAPTCLATGGFGFHTTGQERFGAHMPYSNCNFYWDYGDWQTNGRVIVDFTPYLGKWTRVALVSSGATATFQGVYFNGQLVGSHPTSMGLSSPLTTLDVGRWSLGSADFYYTGSLDDVQIENRLWSAAEILADYRRASTVRRHRMNLQ